MKLPHWFARYEPLRLRMCHFCDRWSGTQRIMCRRHARRYFRSIAT